MERLDLIFCTPLNITPKRILVIKFMNIKFFVNAMREGLPVEAASRWTDSLFFSFELDSSNIVWRFLNYPSLVPKQFLNIIREYKLFFRCDIQWTLSHFHKLENEKTNVLTQIGLMGLGRWFLLMNVWNRALCVCLMLLVDQCSDLNFCALPSLLGFVTIIYLFCI